MFDSCKATKHYNVKRQCKHYNNNNISKLYNNNNINKKKTCCLLVVFECRRCFVNFVNNTKLHQHIRDRYTKKLKIFIYISISSSKLFAIFTSTHISSFLYFCLINHVTRFIFTSKFFVIFTAIFTSSFLHYFCLINHVTRFIFTSLILYLIVKNLHHMFYARFKSTSFFNIQQSLCFARFFDIRLRQMHIILYFKSITRMKLILIRKYAYSRFENQSTRISYLTIVNSHTSIDFFVNNMINLCVNNFSNFFNF